MMLAGILGALALEVAAVTADTADSTANPYHGIVDRNVFNLHDPPPPPDPASTKPPTPKFYLTGITTFLGKRAMFNTTPTPMPGKPGEQPKEHSYMLSEGQRDGEVEVLEIDEIAKLVKINYAGEAMTLDFTNNAAKAVASALPPLPGAGGALPRVIPPRGIGFPPGAPAGRPGPASGWTRPIRPTGPGGASAQASPAGPWGAPVTTGPAVAQAESQGNPGVTKDQQEMLMEFLREQSKASEIPMPPLPPTSLTPLIEADAGSANPRQNPGTGFAPPVPRPSSPFAPPPPPMPVGRPF